MTADEMIDNYQKRVGVGDGFTRFGVRELMKAYARCKVDEQRHLCFNNANWADIALEGESKLEEQVLNAPKPEME